MEMKKLAKLEDFYYSKLGGGKCANCDHITNRVSKKLELFVCSDRCEKDIYKKENIFE
jgi:hypothetical protein